MSAFLAFLWAEPTALIILGACLIFTITPILTCVVDSLIRSQLVKGAYFNVEIAQGVTARFKRHPTTGQLFVFRANCAENGNVWNEPGYGYGKWEAV